MMKTTTIGLIFSGLSLFSGGWMTAVAKNIEHKPVLSGQPAQVDREELRAKSQQKNKVFFSASRDPLKNQPQFHAVTDNYLVKFNEQAAFFQLGSDKNGSGVINLEMKYLGASINPEITGEKQITRSSGKSQYSQVRYKSLYPGVDLLFYGKDGELEYDFIIEPKANYQQVKLSFDGVINQQLDDEGNLHIQVKTGELVSNRPYVYQLVGGQKKVIEAGYVLNRGVVSFQLAGDYDPNYPVIIDPILSYSTLVGGFGGETKILDSAIDSAGNAYVTGSVTVPATASTPLHTDAFVRKYNATSSAIEYETTISGGGNEVAYGIAVDAQNNAYVTGKTSSTDLSGVGAGYRAVCADFWGVVSSVPWLSQSSNVTTHLNKVIWVPSQSLFVAIGDGGVIITSPDGLSWNPQNSTVTDNLNDIIFTATKLVVVGNNGVILSGSLDAANWVKENSGGTTQHLNGVSHTGSVPLGAAPGADFVAVGDGGTLLSSADGVTWAPVVIGTQENLLSIAFGVSQSAVSYYQVVGANGITLKFIATPSPAWVVYDTGIAEDYTDVVWESKNRYFVTVGSLGNSYKNPPTPEGWTLMAAPTTSLLNEVAEVVDATNQANFLSVGASGALLVGSPSGQGTLNWQSIDIPFTEQFNGVTYNNANNNLVMVGDNGKIVTAEFVVGAGVDQASFSKPNGLCDDGGDAFVTKIDPMGSIIVSSYLGPKTVATVASSSPTPANDVGMAIEVNNAGVFVAGITDEADFDVIAGGHKVVAPGSQSIFVSGLSLDLTTLNFSTYLGGNGYDQVTDMAVDVNGDLYIAGYTSSTNTGFATVGAADEKCGVRGQCDNLGNNRFSYDGFVSKLKNDGTALLYSTYLGGGDYDYANGVDVNAAGEAFIVGMTRSTDFPVVNSFQSTLADSQDAFFTRLSADGAAFLSSSYLGGGHIDVGQAIALDSADNAYLSGVTSAVDFPLAMPFIDQMQGSSDVFVTKINTQTNTISYSSYLGGKNKDTVTDLALFSGAEGMLAYVSGYTLSENFPASSGVVQPICSSEVGGRCTQQEGFISQVLDVNGDLSVTIGDDVDPVELGAPVSYTITVSNNGMAMANRVEVEYALPDDAKFQSASVVGGSQCVFNGVVVQCSIDQLASGSKVTVLVAIVPERDTTLVNNVSVSAYIFDGAKGNNTASENTQVIVGDRSNRSGAGALNSLLLLLFLFALILFVVKRGKKRWVNQ